MLPVRLLLVSPAAGVNQYGICDARVGRRATTGYTVTATNSGALSTDRATLPGIPDFAGFAVAGITSTTASHPRKHPHMVVMEVIVRHQDRGAAAPRSPA